MQNSDKSLVRRRVAHHNRVKHSSTSNRTCHRWGNMCACVYVNTYMRATTGIKIHEHGPASNVHPEISNMSLILVLYKHPPQQSPVVLCHQHRLRPPRACSDAAAVSRPWDLTTATNNQGDMVRLNSTQEMGMYRSGISMGPNSLSCNNVKVISSQ